MMITQTVKIKNIIFVLTLFLFFGSVSGCYAEIPEKTVAAGAKEQKDMDYTVFNDLLGEYVSGGRVDYVKWKKEDFDLFEGYINELGSVSLGGLDADERKAFWINAYNAVTIYAVLKRIPKNKLLANAFTVQVVPGFFGGLKYNVAGEELTLNDIENIKLREGFNDPRIHFSIVCASGSCPKLQDSIFSAQGLDQRLDEASRIFIRDTTRNRLDRKKDILYLSQMFKWFEEDFVKDSGSVINFVKKYLDGSDSTYLGDHETKKKFLHYSWMVNIKK